MAPLRNKELTLALKREVVKLRRDKPTWTVSEVRDAIQSKHGVFVSENQLHRVFRSGNKLLELPEDSTNSTRRRIRTAHHVDFETILAAWCEDYPRRGGVLTYSLIRKKAKELSPPFHLPPSFSFSQGWCQNFCRRHHFKRRMAEGERRSADDAGAAGGRLAMRAFIETRQYSPSDIFNMDETACFIKQLPARTMARGPVAGGKVDKERITVGLCVNYDGSHKMAPIIIGRAKRPRYDKLCRNLS
jgi:hypothetical protein